MLVDRAQKMKMHQSELISNPDSFPKGIPLPDAEVQERKRMREWCERVGYSGCPAPSNPLKMRPWEPPFTVLPHVWLCNADFQELMRGLQAHGWTPAEGFRWQPIRDYEPFEECPFATPEEVKFWREKRLPDPTSYLAFMEITTQESKSKAHGLNDSVHGKETRRGGFHISDQSTCEIHGKGSGKGKGDPEPSQPVTVTLPIIENQQRCRVYNVVKRGKIIKKLKVPHGYVIRKVNPNRAPKIHKPNMQITTTNCNNTVITNIDSASSSLR